MKVLFIARATLYSSPGGDTRQLDETAHNLLKLGIDVDVALTNTQPDYRAYDLLHFFNIIRPADILRHSRRAGKPYVVSTIYVQYGAADRVARGGLAGAIGRMLNEDGMEWVKAVARMLKNGERLPLRYFLIGHRQAVQEVAKGAAMLLPNSASEYRRFVAAYDIERPHCVVPNGVNLADVRRHYNPLPAYEGAVLCMGRIEARKNQLRLIEALNNTALRVFIHGRPSPNAVGYANACAEAAASNIQILPPITGATLYAAYASAKVHVLPSYFETTGLSSLEAAAMGCNIVVTDRGDTRDYFGDRAWYCDPDDPASIRGAVEAAHAAPYDEKFRAHILKNYTWQRAGEETLAAYEAVLSGRVK
jgi:glycosyltransferase involved in cell wall biosynthesis